MSEDENSWHEGEDEVVLEEEEGQERRPRATPTEVEPVSEFYIEGEGALVGVRRGEERERRGRERRKDVRVW